MPWFGFGPSRPGGGPHVVYVDPIGDHGWSYQHHKGLEAIRKEFGDKVETTFVESVSEGPDSERVIRQLAQSGNQLIFTTSFGYMNPTLKVAKRFPKVKFEHATGFKRSKNVSTYNIRYYEGRYVDRRSVVRQELRSNLVFGPSESSGDQIGLCYLDTVFELYSGYHLGQIIEAA